ncbi:lipopolysaccharide biosynthesis protein [Noviherbaspirillum massiliense]|uniref:lipopolysaccharide biosynthesis protein n=1 Tax=Noviherbaspirillum massiliense TaxID=1465823 RepID=UPI0002DB45E0|nr:lipopolysaccharide biosynthesis protein [Noviherbaspirillum massiliense]
MDNKANISSKGISAVFWGGFGSILRALLQIATQIVLARLLGPEEYGIFAIAMIVLTFSKFFSDIGISYGLIQKKTISDNDIKFVFTWQVLLGLTVGTVVYLLAGPLSNFFNQPRVMPVIQVASAICFINAIASPSHNLLKRELDFKSIQAASVLGYIVGYIFVGIPLAVAGQQVWALIAAFIGSELTTLALLYWKSRHPIGFVLWQRGDNHLIVYGSRVFLTNAVNWFLGNADRIIIGRAFPAAEVGLYSLSYNLVSSPAGTVITVIQSALFSASARVQDDRERLRRAFLTMMGVVTLLLFPVFAGIAVAAETILQTLYGEAWLGATALLRPVSLAMPVYILFGMATPLLWVSGQTSKEFRIQIPVAIGFVIAGAFASFFSLEAVAWMVFAMYLARAIAVLTATSRALDISLRRLYRAMSGGIITTLITSCGIMLVDFMARELSGIPGIWLLADVLAGVVGMALSLWMFPSLVNRHVAELFEKIAMRLPSPTDVWLQKFLYRVS